MKKLLFILMVFLCVGNANAECAAITGDLCDKSKDKVLSVPDVGCYFCGREYCNNLDTVAVIGPAQIRGNGGYYSNYLYECHRGAFLYDNVWRPSRIRQCTDGGQMELANDPNALQAVYNPDFVGYVRTDGSSFTMVPGRTVCLGYACKSGYQNIGGKCISETESAARRACSNTGGTWVYNDGCHCDDEAFMRTSGDGKTCECISADYEYDPNVKQCKKTAVAIQAEQNRAAAEQEKQAACTQSGGAWSNNACACDENKNLKTENDICVCISADFERDASNNCVKTDLAQLRERCAAAGNDVAYWQNNSCRCRNVDMIWQNDRCVINPDKAICDNMVDAKWLGGGCVCNDDDYEYRNGKCVKTNKTVEREAKAKLTADQNASRGKITTLSTTLKEMQEGFKVTVWRNEDGTFNTTRLASDSIAAVVLGTTGGVVTSHVVKKNQVNKGFDDIQCTVGGQSVAGWGDEFRVGIQ